MEVFYVKKRISVILSENAIKEVRERMLLDGYSLREKSRWISEAIDAFLDLKEYHALVKIAELVDDFSKKEVIYVSDELESKIDQAIVDVRREYPDLEGVKSLIVRASIVRRLVLSPQK